jgi:hypothetical protein
MVSSIAFAPVVRQYIILEVYGRGSSSPFGGQETKKKEGTRDPI